MKVLITRPQPDADSFAELCRARKCAPIISPLMEIEVIETEIDLYGVGALAFTSANGVRVFAKGNFARHLPVFAVGEASASTARTSGFENIHVAGGDVDRLAEMIVEQKATLSGEVLHITGSHRAGDLVTALTQQGMKARRLVLYHVRDASELPSDARSALASNPPVEWVALFSPRSAELFLTLTAQAGLIDALAHIKVVCLSAAVAKKVGVAKWKSVEIAAGPNAAAMIELIVSA